jgi:hypothetical protein
MSARDLLNAFDPALTAAFDTAAELFECSISRRETRSPKSNTKKTDSVQSSRRAWTSRPNS